MGFGRIALPYSCQHYFILPLLVRKPILTASLFTFQIPTKSEYILSRTSCIYSPFPKSLCFKIKSMISLMSFSRCCCLAHCFSQGTVRRQHLLLFWMSFSSSETHVPSAQPLCGAEYHLSLLCLPVISYRKRAIILKENRNLVLFLL